MSPPDLTILSPADQTLLSPSDETLMSPPDLTILSPLDETLMSPPDLTILSPPDQTYLSPSICAKCYAGRTEKPPQRHLAKSLYPFQRIQIDHIQMPKSGRYEYALVIVNMFSGWPEAYPVTNMTAKTTVKRLLTEVICRYGVPEVIESDQGPAFTAVLAKEIWTALGVTLSFHTPYHPQSSGKVEHSEVITGTHQLLPGDWVLVKRFVRKTPLEPRYEGPFQVLLITATSVKLEGKATWVHASHCKKVPSPDNQELTQ
ncbi:uncharacterized protein O3C94_020196 [Discoglossus pictus]